jgi:hypothetical protein
MSGFFKRNINGILGTILFHLIVVVVTMSLRLAEPRPNNEEYFIVETEFLEEMTKTEEDILKDENSLEDFDIENYLKEIRNVGANRQDNRYSNIDALSEEELRQKYESELLKEKYGNDYEKRMNLSHEDFLKNKDNPTKDKNKSDANANTSSNAVNYSGPVFTCENSGRVVVGISIAPDGSVRSANIVSTKCSGDATCISNAAREAALKSKFSAIAGGKTETGTITYSFIEQ